MIAFSENSGKLLEIPIFTPFSMTPLVNLAALCLEEAAKKKEKIVTADIVNMVTAELSE